MTLIQNSKKNRERGVALFMAIFALMLLSAIAAGFVFMANTETAINANFRSSQQAYFAAKGGLEEARNAIRVTGGTVTPPAQIPSLTNGGIVYILNSNTESGIEPYTASNKYFDNTLCKANYDALALSYGTQGVPCTAATPSGNAWHTSTAVSSLTGWPLKWSRISLKVNRSSSPLVGGTDYPYAVDPAGSNAVQVCWDGDTLTQKLLPSGYANCATPPKGKTEMRPVYLLTALAQTANGTRRVVSMEVADDPPFLSNSAVNSQDVIQLKGSSLTIDGTDTCGCDACTVDTKTSIKTCSQRVGSPYTCMMDKYSVYGSSAINLSGNPTLVAGTDPPYIANQPETYNIPQLIERYKNRAGTVPFSPTYGSCGTSGSDTVCPASGTFTGDIANPIQRFGVPPAFPPTPAWDPIDRVGYPEQSQVTYIPGNIKLKSTVPGNGVLVVDGDLEVNGGLQFYGLIIVKGVVSFTGGASQNNIYGAILAGKSTVNNTDSTVGGSVTINYDQCSLRNAGGANPPRVLITHENQ
ncbi:MAG TPA: hypothetical protein VM056_05250 [Terriglobales bacterium]|nr:hypothetical protein [Terriglobales bacterium]